MTIYIPDAIDAFLLFIHVAIFPPGDSNSAIRSPVNVTIFMLDPSTSPSILRSTDDGRRYGFGEQIISLNSATGSTASVFTDDNPTVVPKYAFPSDGFTPIVSIELLS